MSGYPQEAVLRNEIVDPAPAFLAKSFTIGELTARGREALDAVPSPTR
jgi:hypothetical protein